MKKYLLLLSLIILSLIMCCIAVNAQTITAAEYFVDADPGAGSGTPVSITAGTNVNFTAIIPATSLPGGFHFVAIRTKDAAGKWGVI